MPKLALKWIREAKEKRLTRLDLSNSGIKELPRELRELNWLEELNLSGLAISDLRVLSSLGELKQLNLNGTLVKDLKPLAELVNLANLRLWDTKISDIQPLASLGALTQLELRRTRIRNIQPLARLVNLQQLDLSRTPVIDIRPLLKLANLNQLNLGSTWVRNVELLGKLGNLTHLDLMSTKVSNIRPLASLKKLIQLNLAGTLITETSVLAYLCNLMQVDISNTLISAINSLGHLSQLTQLEISDTHVSDLQALVTLPNLAILYANHTPIIDIQPLTNCVSLSRLALSNTHINDFEVLANLTGLTRLDLSQTAMQTLNPLKYLINLARLDVNATPITDLQPLANLTKLTRLNLSNTAISDLRPIRHILAKDIPVVVKNWLFESSINVKNCPLEYPPLSLVEQGNKAILRYFADLEQQGIAKLNEAKLIIVGEPGAGKTSLMKKLIDPHYSIPQEEPATLGIQVCEGWQFPHPQQADAIFSANIWDFGGQQIQYMTHQFFLTAGAVYILVSANDRKETTANFPYWFKIIHLLGEENNVFSPILVVQNDKNGQFIHPFDEMFYRQRYPELLIQQCKVNLSSSSSAFAFLCEEIQKLLTSLPHVNDARPARWEDIRSELRRLTQEKNHISFAEYAVICNKHAVTDTQSQLNLSYYLHKLGSILHFATDPVLRDFIILNPQWAVDAVYSVLEDKEIYDNGGYFRLTKLEQIWAGKYDPIEQSKLLNLMKKQNFEICYEVECAHNLFIAPQLLSDLQPYFTWECKDNLKFRFQYKFMPEGIITRLIVRLNEYIAKGEKGDLVWRKGMLLIRHNCRALIREEENRDGLKVIDIMINGNKHERKYLLRTIRDEVEKLHGKWFKNIQAEQMIPCNCDYCTHPYHKDIKYFEYHTLLKYQERNKTTIECDKGINAVTVLSLLEGVFVREEMQQILQRGDVMADKGISHIHVGANSQVIIGDHNVQKQHADNTVLTLDQRKVISAVLDEFLKNKGSLSDDVLEAAYDVRKATKVEPAKQSAEQKGLLTRVMGGFKQLAGFTDDLTKIGKFVTDHQDDISQVLTNVQGYLP